MPSEIRIRQLKASDTDLATLTEDLNSDDWTDFEYPFTTESLRNFLEDDSHIYLIALVDNELAGALHAYAMYHPSGRVHFYIDEVDTKKQFRRKGVASAMMQEALKIAGARGYDEAWLGTEHDNEPAKALYTSLNPSEVEEGPIYSWKTK